MANLILILGDQLTPDISALDDADKQHDRIVMGNKKQKKAIKQNNSHRIMQNVI